VSGPRRDSGLTYKASMSYRSRPSDPTACCNHPGTSVPDPAAWPHRRNPVRLSRELIRSALVGGEVRLNGVFWSRVPLLAAVPEVTCTRRVAARPPNANQETHRSSDSRAEYPRQNSESQAIAQHGALLLSNGSILPLTEGRVSAAGTLQGDARIGGATIRPSATASATRPRSSSRARRSYAAGS
jgi:hypothetical protein